MRITGRERLDAFCERHADARAWIEQWVDHVQRAAWSRPLDVRQHYAAASFLPRNVVIFNVKGNAYRLEVVIGYEIATVAVQWAGTHREYDERNKRR